MVMMQYKTGKYHLEIYEDSNYSKDAADNLHHYDFVYLKHSEYRCASIFGIKIYQNEQLLKSAVIGSTEGVTTLHDTSTIIENDRIVICCSDSIFCLSIPNLALLWQTQADLATCLEIYKYKDSYIIHGELEISRLDKDGKILWRNGGMDIFLTLDGNSHLIITENYILATDWDKRKYKFDFNGEIILR